MTNRDSRNDRTYREDRRRNGVRGGAFGGDYARDDWPYGLGGDYARDEWRRGLSGDYALDQRWGGTGASGDYFGSNRTGRGSSYVGYGPGQSRGTFGGDYRGFGAADAVYGGTTGPANLGMATEFGGPRDPQSRQPGNTGGSAEAYGGSSAVNYRGVGPKNYRRPDLRIEEDVNDALTEDDTLDASGIAVSVKDGEVTLAGTVRSRDSKRRAEDVAERCFGVKDVHNRLRIDDRESDVHIGKASE